MADKKCDSEVSEILSSTANSTGALEESENVDKKHCRGLILTPPPSPPKLLTNEPIAKKAKLVNTTVSVSKTAPNKMAAVSTPTHNTVSTTIPTSCSLIPVHMYDTALDTMQLMATRDAGEMVPASDMGGLVPASDVGGLVPASNVGGLVPAPDAMQQLPASATAQLTPAAIVDTARLVSPGDAITLTCAHSNSTHDGNLPFSEADMANTKPPESPPPAFFLAPVRLTYENLMSQMAEEKSTENSPKLTFYSDGNGGLFYERCDEPLESSSESEDSWISGEHSTEDGDYVMDDESETDESVISSIPEDNMKMRLRGSFKIMNKIYGNFGLLLENLETEKKNLSEMALCRGEYLPIDLKMDMIEKCRAKMVECVNQLKDISMQDIMAVVYTGERLCDMEGIRNYLQTEHKTLETWTKDRLQELQQRIDFFNENIGTLVKVKVVLKNGGDKLINSNFPVWRLMRFASEDSLSSEGFINECPPIRYILAKCKKERGDHKRDFENGSISCEQCAANTGGNKGRRCEILSKIDRKATDEIDEHKRFVLTGYFTCDICDSNENSDIELTDSSDDDNNMDEN